MCPSRECKLKLSDKSLWRPWEPKEELLSQVAPRQTGITRSPASSSPLKCSICFRSFKRDSELRRHKNSKHLRKLEKCWTCGKVFTRKDNLTRHHKMAHLEKGKPSCQFCRKPLSRRDAVQRHESRCPKNSSRRVDKQVEEAKPSSDTTTLTLTHIQRLSRKHPKLNANSSDEEEDCPSDIKRLTLTKIK